MKKIFAFIIFSLISTAFALNCKICKKEINGRYMKDKHNNVFCSEKCFAETAPKCTLCKKACVKGIYTFMKKPYCSKKCLEQISKCANCDTPSQQIRIIINTDGTQMLFCPSCAGNPKCYFCSLPYKTRKLADGRHICQTCRKTAVSSKQQILSRLKYVRKKLNQLYGFDMNHYIELIVLDLNELERESGGIYQPAGGFRIALMRYNYEISEKKARRGRTVRKLQNEKCRIFILNNTPRDLLDDALAHELTHDYLRHNAGKISDLSVEEGFAETIASQFNKAVKKPHLNKRKEANNDPVYGGGYRKISKILKQKGFKKTVEYVKSFATPVI